MPEKDNSWFQLPKKRFDILEDHEDSEEKTWKVLEDLLEEYVPVVPRHFLKASDTC